MSSVKVLLVAAILFLSINHPVSASESRIFVGYELGEMAFNEFRHFAGEIGFALNDRRAVRLTIVNVALTERHLSSNEASIVDGENVTGDWKGIDVYYDFALTNNLLIGPSIGYHDSEYRHTILNESVSHNSPSIGLAASYRGDSVFGNSNFYWRFSITGRYFFNQTEQTTLGDTVVNEIKTEVVPLIFVGYNFR